MRVAVAAVAVGLLLGGCFDLSADRVEPTDYLRGDGYDTWIIEVDYSSGEQPPAALLNFAKDRLAPLVHKSKVEFQMGSALPTESTTAWTSDDVRAFAKRHKDVPTAGRTVSTHLLFLGGHAAQDSGNAKVLGAAYDHDLIVIFSQSVKSTCESRLPPLPPIGCHPDPYFRAVLMHEFGHILGLVNHGIPMVRDHEATSCGGNPDQGHSTNESSVMYCQVESSFIVQLSNPPTNFDADDRADLRAAGGR